MVQFLRMEFSIKVIRHQLRNLGYKFQLNQSNVWMHEEITYIATACILLCNLNGYLVTFSLKSSKTVHFSA